MRARKAVHPLLLEPAYWRNRLQVLEDEPSGVVWTPRPDLSEGGCEVTEFRIRAHDGVRLWGLFARPTWQSGPWPATVRSVGPAVRPTPCPATAQAGTAEFLFQEPAGRRLTDRVMDVMQVCRLALATKGIGEVQVQHDHAAIHHRDPGASPTVTNTDELLIVEQLLSHRIASVSPRAD
ncbi:hypothetical protein Poly30_46700 [Planctomycetes bacterium Poly30]|uniref:Uncharacterized protein n=1 Tax=Saltatorellus ferox TaxID=2528018 RepID=A0A518EYF5_9BACT|nr:hypothetical protein Poly30_46700 [Planctomycetes bacterium Poly30]